MCLSIFGDYDKITVKVKEYFMKKLLILPIIMAMCAVETSTFAAPRSGRGGGTSGSNASAAPKANGARAAKMGGGKVTNPGKSTGSTTGGSNAAATKPSAGKPNGARAAATKKAINMGTKVSTAVENTTISTECQNAYYGCMDAFCMMDNASGGRCQCNDRITELDKILDEIMKLDEKSMNLATQGVEKVQMGELASQIDARAKSLEKEFLTDEEKKQQAAADTSKKRQLDLSAWNNSSMFDDDEIFGGNEEKDDFKIEDDLANKKGDELHKSAAKICTQQIPAECKTSAAMLQQTYAQKIRSDCTGYENALKQQRTASAQKLQTAQRAVREALLDEEKNKNKYEDLGSCVIAFKQCMQTTGECGTDFGGCVADTSILSALYGKTKGTKNGKVATTQIKTGATTVTISSATYDILQNKAMRCESVVRQCQNANGGVTLAGGKVLGEFMKDVALTVYNTEYNMASNSRMNCLTTIINCVKKSCKSAGMDEGTDNYDSCLSNPDSIKNYCSLEIKRCGDVGSENDVVAYVQAKLAADRVDRCTEQIKECLQSEDRCGEDYAGCIGLSTDRIVALCPFDKLIACQTKYNKDTVQDYVAEVAQGLALNINNSYGEICEEAADKAMTEVCGGTTTCENATLSDNLFVNDILTVQLCKEGTTTCSADAYSFAKEDLIAGKITPRVVGRLDLSVVGYKDFSATPVAPVAQDAANANTNATPVPEKIFSHDPLTNVDATAGYKESDLEKLEVAMQNAFNLKIKQIQADRTVNACLVGKDFQGISKKDGTSPSDSGNGARFPNLLDAYKVVIAQQLVDQLWELYAGQINKLKEDKWDDVQKKLDARIDEIVQFEADKQHRYNEAMCNARKETPDFYTGCTRRGRRGVTYGATVAYDSATSTCTVTRKEYRCSRRVAGCCWSWQQDKDAKVTATDKIPMKKVNRGSLVDKTGQ